MEKLFSVKSWEEPQPSLSAQGVDMIKLLASTFILNPLMNHVKYGNTFALIYADFHTLRLGDLGVVAFFFGVSFIVKNGIWKSCYYGFYLKLFVMANLPSCAYDCSYN